MIKIFGVGRGKRAEDRLRGTALLRVCNPLSASLAVPPPPIGVQGWRCRGGLLQSEHGECGKLIAQAVRLCWEAPAAKKKQPGEIRMQKAQPLFVCRHSLGL